MIWSFIFRREKKPEVIVPIILMSELICDKCDGEGCGECDCGFIWLDDEEIVDKVADAK